MPRMIAHDQHTDITNQSEYIVYGRDMPTDTLRQETVRAADEGDAIMIAASKFRGFAASYARATSRG